MTRETLYAEVWAEPMLVVAARYGVSSSYLARVCAALNVPRPAPGYWNKMQVGKAPARPALPPAEPGQALEWVRGEEARLLPRRPPRPRRRASQPPLPPLSPRPDVHPLCSGVRHFFEEGRVSHTGYLRPNKQLLVDLFVSNDTLDRALELASRCFLAMEDQGHRVVIAPHGEQLQRPDLLTGEKSAKDTIRWESWRPIRPTVAYVGSVAFGLTVYEVSEEAEVEYGRDWKRYVRVTETARTRRNKFRHPDVAVAHMEDMPTGLLALHAYSPYPGVTWERRWREKEAGDLLARFEEIRLALRRAVKTVVAGIKEEERRAEERRRQWELERARWEREAAELRKAEEERRRIEEYKRSREQLLALVGGWSLACQVESFFENVKQRAETLDGPERDAIHGRLEAARQMLGGTDALKYFERWKSPSDRNDPPSDEDGDEGV